ncbi:hypothetical protein FOMG_19824 [Fusarium oxysporum f. sp. melonis 26406]|uniref:Uncharacterized protein n=1 Tax=Fusarium oxysporum f. sp. melonis 26406 TaxID=1089452 RepID=W9Z425_FUSOX|nr:hypothetical protein FOMG_19824 [Fusarium oxysporum f. sp. melonis 26406]
MMRSRQRVYTIHERLCSPLSTSGQHQEDTRS